MKSSARLGLGLIVVGSLFAFAGCGDDDDSGTDGGGGTTAHGGSAAGGDDHATGGASGDAKCEEIAELCHEVDDGNGPLHDCHVMAEAGNTETCLASYDDCFTRCTAAHEALEGAGGAGGAAAGGASGEGLGGAGGDGAGGVTAAGTAGSAG
jgi:hypothetical protein